MWFKRKKPKHPWGPLEEKWESYTGTGITANKGKNSIALRKAIDESEFAIVKLFGGCREDSPLQVIEEIKTSSREEAEKQFQTVAKKLGFKIQPIRRSLVPMFVVRATK